MSLPFIPFANPGAGYASRKERIMKAVSRSFDSGYYILGSEVEAFEKAFAEYLGLRHTIGCANGTDAIELALRSMEGGPGKAVLTVSHTAVATVAAIERAGAIPVLVDIDPSTYTMASNSLEEAILWLRDEQPEIVPAVVVPVHIYGHPCDMNAITTVAARYGMAVLEDCAQSHGALYKGRMTGTFGHSAAFSFYPTKNLGALGDGGAVATNDEALAVEIDALRQYGWKERFISAVPGFNSRLDPVQAAILSIQLEYLDADNAVRKRIATIYSEALQGCGLVLPSVAPWADHVFHLYVVLCDDRPAFMEFLKVHRIGTAVHYPVPVHLQPAYKERIFCAPGGLPVTEKVADSLVSLPMFPQLDDDQVHRICAAVTEWAKAGS
jgi:dTDP-4-amino-4,6-dideoxygalactose transaminase